ncbi:MAG: hypothetical protein HC769_18690 [Cyanobacteria bacterium CRU_2_1]|nr:hypothetical protein [Cyanobacteria bacterium CRU_2_1]
MPVTLDQSGSNIFAGGEGSDGDLVPGTVVAIGRESRLCISDCAYNKRVAGIIAGAGDLKPGIILGRDCTAEKRLPVALVGRAYCKVDATYGAIEVGDLLTTSPTPGYAMKAIDPLRAFGAVIGKAFGNLDKGTGLIPVLILRDRSTGFTREQA